MTAPSVARGAGRQEGVAAGTMSLGQHLDELRKRLFRSALAIAVKLVLAVGIAFVLPVFVVLLNFLGILSARAILGAWRIAVLSILVVTALVTPSADIASMFLLAVPMAVLYLAACAVAWLHDRHRDRRLAAASSTTLP